MISRYLSGILVSFSLLWSACSNDFEVTAPYQHIPLVYSILDISDTIHYVRIQKSFAGEGSALDMARQSDSIYYQQAHVALERWKDRVFAESFDLIRTQEIIKDSGLFSIEDHHLFYTTETLDPTSEYRLNISLPEIETELSAATFLVSGIRLIKPSFNQPTISFSNYDRYVEVEWLSTEHAKIYYLQLRLNYLEVYDRDTTRKQAVWSIAHFPSVRSSGGERMETMVSNRQFYQWLPSKIPEAEPGIKRIIPKEALDFIFTIGGEELHTYLEIHKSNRNPMIQTPVYTNIVNGIGLFSSRTTQEITGRALTYSSIDSIAHGQYTHQLGFVDTTDDFYRR